MTGAIYLGGGGSADDEETLWRTMFAGRTRITYWPFALPPHHLVAAEQWLRDALARLDLRVDVEVWAQLQEHSPAELASADLLFVGGGNTFRLLDQVRRHRFVTAVRDYVAAGGAYYGGSAGAVLAGTDITIARGLDDNEVGLTDLSALGLVPEFTVLPHFTRDQEAFARAWCGEHRRVVLGVPERAGLVAESGTVQVLGTEAVWQFTEAGVSEHAPGERWALTSPRTPGLNDRGER